ncbi:SDR family oxidoreductase [Mycobacterium sp. 852002-30065_SCH5024008]|uniref:SDR family oxidoreductase n=1 Tax=Mycobacterium sp. 852002-30065_SCH5024008 TaxID=1834088 RepID=UPI0007FCC1CC|nr:NAD(P)H-binding protein [Mycobacterium sp. 852002-30065_SCH5024008]OBB87808.1 NmrA family protein [Mycobacterium sp. 852002-30065_SCH5024008]
MRRLTTIAVIGATGTAGSRVVDRLKARDVAVVEISRAHGVDLLDGASLYRALNGVDVAIDVSNPVADDGPDIAQTLATASRNVMGVCAARGVQRLVVSTMAGIDDPVFDGLGYFEAKRAAKEILLDGPVPTTVVKSTPWYESATGPAGPVSCDGDEVIVEDWLVQPIAADTVADVLVEAALGQTHTPRIITGPDTIRLPELTSKVLARQGDSRTVRAVQPRVPALATGALLACERAVVVGPGVESWLSSLPPASTDGHAKDGADNPDASVHRPDFSRV